jgi:hypothetical protein
MNVFTITMWFSLEWLVAGRLGLSWYGMIRKPPHQVWDDQEASTPGMG